MNTMDNRDWVYFGVFLDDKSRAKLYALTKTVVDDTWRVFCHHMTIAFNNNSKAARDMFDKYADKFGTEVELVATHLGISDDAIAVKVPYAGETLNKFPHITLATPANGRPVNSNYITTWHELDKPIKLKGIFNVFKKQ